MKPRKIFTAIALNAITAGAIIALFVLVTPKFNGIPLLIILSVIAVTTTLFTALRLEWLDEPLWGKPKKLDIKQDAPVLDNTQQQNRTTRVQPEVEGEVKFITAEDVERIVKERIEQYINSQIVKDSPIQEPIQEVVYASMSERKKAEAEGKIIIAQPVTQVEQEPEIKKEVMPLEPPSYLGNKQILEMLIALFEKKPGYRDARWASIMYIVNGLCENITNREYLIHIALTTDRYFRYIQQKLPKMRGSKWAKRQRQSGRKEIVDLTPEQQEAADLFIEQLKLF